MNMLCNIGNYEVGNGQQVFIIAEIGVNHNGSCELALALIDAAKKAGANAVKFQIFQTDELASELAPLADYQQNNGMYQTQQELLQRLELGQQEFIRLKDYCEDIGILFLATAFDLQSAKFLKQLDVPAYKVGSGDLTHYPLLKELSEDNKPLILSTGMSTLEEIQESVMYIQSINQAKPIVLLHCTSSYPAPDEQLNLNVLRTYQQLFPFPIGYSDHSLGLDVPIAVTALGTSLLEKHLTLDKHAEGPDHKASLCPQEFADMVKAIRRIEAALGGMDKRVTENEYELRVKVRRGIFAARDMKPGEVITEKDLLYLRPMMGISVKYYEHLIGKVVKDPKKKGTPFTWDDVS